MESKTKQSPKYTKKKIFISFGIVITLFLIMAISSALTGDDKKDSSTTKAESDNTALVSAVNRQIDDMDEDTRTAFAATSEGGYQGDIIRVDPAVSKGGVKVTVSTYFKETGRENDGGQNIAWKLLGIMCIQVPELESIYVVSQATGLESKTIYRHDIPGCN